MTLKNIIAPTKSLFILGLNSVNVGAVDNCSPYAIQIVNGYAYIANFGTTLGTGGSISVCTVKADGTLDPCSQVQTGLPNPVTMTAYNGYIYFGLFGGAITTNDAIWSCPITSPGALGPCAAALNNITTQASGLVAYNNFMYVTTGSNPNYFLLRCSFLGSGALNCNTDVTPTGGGGSFTLNNPHNLSVY